MAKRLLCAVAAFGLVASGALAQTTEKSGGAAQAPAAGGAEKLPPGGAGPGKAPGGAEKVPGATGGAASPGLKPTPQAETQPGQRQTGENVGVEPPKPATGGARPKANAGEEAKPGQDAAGKPEGEAKTGAATKPAPKLTSAQSTRVKTAFRDVHVAPVHVDFDVHVGVAVPRTVVLEPVPPAIVTIVPDYEGFRYFVVPGEIVIVDPVTLAIVAVLPL